MGNMNERSWSSSRHGMDNTENQHKGGKAWYHTCAPKRVKKRWNKKRGQLEVSKKGSQEYYVWSN